MRSSKQSMNSSDFDQALAFANQEPYAAHQLAIGCDNRQDMPVKIDILTKVAQKLRQLTFSNTVSQATAIDNVGSSTPSPSLAKQQPQWPPRQVEILPLDLAQPLAPFELLCSLKQRGLENKVSKNLHLSVSCKQF